MCGSYLKEHRLKSVALHCVSLCALAHWFSVNRKDGTGGRWVNSHPAARFGIKRPRLFLALSVINYRLGYTNGLRKYYSHFAGVHLSISSKEGDLGSEHAFADRKC